MKHEITNFVTSFELSKEIYDLGFRRDSIFSWFTDGTNTQVGYSNEDNLWETYGIVADAKYPTYLSAELGELFRPLHYADGNVGFIRTYRHTSRIHCCELIGGLEPHRACTSTEANARGKMVIYLIKEKLIKLNEKDTLPG